VSKKRINYKECRERLACLLDNTSIFSRKEIVGVLGISFESLIYMNPYHKFHNFLCYTRRYAFREYSKAIGEKIPISNIINLKFILSKTTGSVSEFIQFCQTERIPLLYYIHQIKKYIFPNKLLFSPIFNRLLLIFEAKFYNSLKWGEIFGYLKSFDDIFKFYEIFELNSNEKKNEGKLYLKALIRKNYIFGEEIEQMFKRLKYKKHLKELNEEIERNLYSISNLEIFNEEGEDLK